MPVSNHTNEIGTERGGTVSEHSLDRRHFMGLAAGAAAAVVGTRAVRSPAVRRSDAASKGTIAISLPFEGSNVYNALLYGVAKQAKIRGYSYVRSVSPDDASKQLDELDSWLALPVRAILLFPLSPNALAPIVKQAHSQKIWVAGYASPVPGENGYIVFNNDQSGHLLGEAAAKYVHSIGGKAEVALIAADSEPVGHARVQSAWEELHSLAPGAKLVARPQVPSGQPAQAYTAMQSVLAANPNVNVVIGIDDEEEQGIAQAFLHVGRAPSTWWIGGADGSLLTLQQILSGKIHGATAALPLQSIGEQAINVPANLIEGKKPTQVTVDYVLVDNSTPALARQLIGAYKG
jgi:ribose transport system substrate-binding protein